MEPLNETANRILDRAEHYTQTRGFNAFSYRDIQDDLGIKTSSIHYYFPTKNDLALCMMERYIARYQAVLSEIKQSHVTALKKLQQLGNIFIAASKEDKFCLCGMLAMDNRSMPEVAQKKLKTFFQISEKWIAQVIEEGIAAKDISDNTHPEHEASCYLASLEGALIISRAAKRPHYVSTIINACLAKLAR